ncbi:MCE family protein [Anaplasmataceae bacterium AB001_6]|nr:MCE family protein [Anaplasmataceae bacterium AB001_6]
MISRKLEFVLGLLVISCAIFIVVTLFSRVAKNTLEEQSTSFYNVTAVFKNSQSMNVNAKIKISGVDVGYVTDFTLNPKDYSVIFHMMIDSKWDKIPIDSLFAIKQAGIIKDYYVDVQPLTGEEEEYLKEGSVVYNTKQAIGIDDVVSSIFMKFL